VVLLNTPVFRADPFHSTMEFDSNPVPVILMVAAFPGGTYLGEIAVIAGTGLLTVKDAAPDAPPPGAGLTTVMELCELPAKSDAGMVAFTSVVLTNVAFRAVPFQCTTEDERKPVPVISTKVSPDSASILAGSILLITGVALFTEKLAVDVPPPGPGFSTVNFATVASVNLLAGMVTLKLVAELNVEVNDAPFH